MVSVHVLTEYRNSQGVDIVSGTCDNFELFELNFEVAKAYASLGGAEYLVKLLQTNTAFLYHDNVTRVE